MGIRCPRSPTSAGSPGSSGKHTRSASQDLHRRSVQELQRAAFTPSTALDSATPVIPVSFDFTTGAKHAQLISSARSSVPMHRRTRSDGGRIDMGAALHGGIAF